jgi:hypothetical protein
VSRTVRLLPTALGVIEGGLDGVLRDADAKAGRASKGSLHEYSTWYEAALFALSAGALLFTRMNEDLIDPGFYGSAFALGSRFGSYAGTKAGLTTAAATGGPYPAIQRVGVPAVAAAQMSVGYRRQPPGTL